MLQPPSHQAVTARGAGGASSREPSDNLPKSTGRRRRRSQTAAAGSRSCRLHPPRPPEQRHHAHRAASPLVRTGARRPRSRCAHWHAPSHPHRATPTRPRTPTPSRAERTAASRGGGAAPLPARRPPNSPIRGGLPTAFIHIHTKWLLIEFR
eukprot:scaffold296291_cov31-Tisochrysis_lutea.AAC.4